MRRLHDAYPPPPGTTFLCYIPKSEVPYVDHYDHDESVTDKVVFKLNPEKFKADSNKKIDAKIVEFENGMPRLYRNIALSPNAKNTLNISDKDLDGLRAKAQFIEDQISILRSQKK
jgi:hypothetical protein